MIKNRTTPQTKKLSAAVRILSSDEGYSDTSELAWYTALDARRFTSSDVYRVMSAYGWRWDPKAALWYRRARRMSITRRLFSAVREIEARRES